jgi:CheY-like chemotaxis protein
MPPGAPAAPLEGIRLLVVDDSKINLLVAEKLLLHAGASVHLECNGCTAVEWLKKNGRNTDLVLLDVQMPIMDGLTAVGLIRSDPDLCHLPVVAMTGADSDEEMAHALACGMTDHVIKPFNYKTLVAVVLQHVQKNPGSAVSLASETVVLGVVK